MAFSDFKVRVIWLVLIWGILLPRGTVCGQQKATGDEQWRNQFKPGAVAPSGGAGAGKVAETGKIRYTLHEPKEPTEEVANAYAGIEQGMERAVLFYNTNTRLKMNLEIFYSPGTPTADGNIKGTIRFGRNARNARVCMHEICHTVGIGTHANWGKLMVDHRWQGKRGNKLLQEFAKDPQAQLHGDHMHFWPYGLNYDYEVKSDEDFVRHARIVEAMVEDLEEAR